MNSDSNTEQKTIDDLHELFKSGEQEKIIFLVESKKVSVTNENKYLLAGAYTIVGNKESEEAKVRLGEDAELLFKKANNKFNTAFKLNPDSHEILNYWGNSLLRQANTKSGAEAEKIFEESYKKFEKALQIKPDYYEALSNWGNKFSRLALMKEGKESDTFFKKANEKYRKALQIRPDHPHILYNFACSLSEQAKRKKGADGAELFDRANEIFSLAVKNKADYHQALNGWGVSYFEEAQTKSGDEKDKLLGLSQEKLLKAESLKIGSGAYNLACINAYIGKQALCKKWLEKSFTTGYLPPIAQILVEPDLKNVINKIWFKEFIEKVEK
jgi:Tfp pilus assembly protein PilF